MIRTSEYKRRVGPWVLAALVLCAGISVYMAYNSRLEVGMSIYFGVACFVVLTLLGAMVWLLLRSDWTLRAMGRPVRSCLHCGYDLRGLRSGSICPECGTLEEPWRKG